MTSWLHVRGQPQKLCFQVCFQSLDVSLNSLNAWSHITQELVMSRVQNSRQHGNLNLLTIQLRFHSVCKWYPAILHVTANFLLKNQKLHGVIELLRVECCEIVRNSLYWSYLLFPRAWTNIMNFRSIPLSRHVHIRLSKKFVQWNTDTLLDLELWFLLSKRKKSQFTALND